MNRAIWIACAGVASTSAYALANEVWTELERQGLEASTLDAPVSVAPRAFSRGVVLEAVLVAVEGESPPGASGLPVTSIGAPFTNGLGQSGFTGSLDNAGSSDHFVWFDAGIVWRNSDSTSPALSGAESTMGIGDAGEFIYSPSADGDDAVWSHNGLLAVDETPAPGFPPGTVSTFHSRPTMTPSGHAYWVSGFNDAGGTGTLGRVLYGASDATPGSTTVVLRSDDLVDGLAIARPAGIGFDYQLSDNGSHHIHELILDTGSSVNDNAIYVNGSLVARESQPTGDGDNWASFDAVSINDSGDYVFSGDTDGVAASDEFIAHNAGIVLREGDAIGGISLTSPASVQALSINNRGESVFTWSSGGSEYLFAACDAADPIATGHLLLLTGEILDFDGNGIGDATVTDLGASTVVGPGLQLAEDGRVLLEVDLDFGAGEVEGIIALAMPAICNDVIFADGFE